MINWKLLKRLAVRLWHYLTWNTKKEFIEPKRLNWKMTLSNFSLSNFAPTQKRFPVLVVSRKSDIFNCEQTGVLNKKIQKMKRFTNFWRFLAFSWRLRFCRLTTEVAIKVYLLFTQNGMQSAAEKPDEGIFFREHFLANLIDRNKRK